MIYITAHNRNLTLNNDEVTFLDFDKRKRIITVQFKGNTSPTLTIDKADRCFVLDGNSSAEVKSSESNFVTKLKDKINNLTEQLTDKRSAQYIGFSKNLEYKQYFADCHPSKIRELLSAYRETFSTIRSKFDDAQKYSVSPKITEALEYIEDRYKVHQYLEREIP